MFIKPETKEAISNMAETIDFYSNIFLAFALTTSVLVLIIHFVSLMQSGDNPQKKSQALSNITTTLVITAILGIFTTITKFIVYSLL